MARLGSRPGPPEPRSPGFTHWQLIAAAGIGVAALLAYLFTMYPDIAGGDSAISLRFDFREDRRLRRHRNGVGAAVLLLSGARRARRLVEISVAPA